MCSRRGVVRGEPSRSAVASVCWRAVSERLRTWVPAAVGPGASPRLPEGWGRVAARPRLPRTGAALPSSPHGSGTPPLSSPVWVVPGPQSRHSAASARRLTGAGRAAALPQARDALVPSPLSPQNPGPAPWSWSLSRRSCSLPAHYIPLPQPG